MNRKQKRRNNIIRRLFLFTLTLVFLSILVISVFEIFNLRIVSVDDSSSDSQIAIWDRVEISVPQYVETPLYSDEIMAAYMGKVIPECPPVDDSYFENVAFIGDSLTEGFKNMPFVQNSLILAERSVNVVSIVDELIYTDEQGAEYTAIQAVRNYSPKIIYVMLGMNGINWMDTDYMVEQYGLFIDMLKEAVPGAYIIVQEMLPVTREKEATDPLFANSRIYSYNTKLYYMCQEKGAFYLESTVAIRDAEFYLPSEASPYDGIHITAEYYGKWYDYLKTHAIKELA